MNTEDDEFNRIEMESKVRQVMQQAVWDSAIRVPEGDIRALKHRIHTLEGEVIGYKRILDAQPEQEPVAWICEGSSSDEKHSIDYWQEDVDAIPIDTQLYTTPLQRKPLTDEQIETIWRRVQENDFHDCVQPFARAIEAAHGIKENT